MRGASGSRGAGLGGFAEAPAGRVGARGQRPRGGRTRPTQRTAAGGRVGVRHRLGLGRCDGSDAVVRVVSEGTGRISIGRSAQLIPVAAADLKQHLAELLDGNTIPTGTEATQSDLDSQIKKAS